MKFTKLFSAIFILSAFLISCSTVGETQSISEVTRIVEVTREIELPVTRIVEVNNEVTRVVEKEVTRIVEATPIPTSISQSKDDVDPSVAFSANYLGELEQSGIKVELVRVIFMHKDAFTPELNFDENENFDSHEYVAEIIWRITNDTSKKLAWSYEDINVRINDRQLKLYNWLFSPFGETPTDDIFPGSTIVGGVWFGIGNLTPNEINSVTLLLGEPHDANTYSNVADDFIISADLSDQHEWVTLPDELR